ncbi:uncharacterized protein OCT59_010578 [Rhizophagus irregularis]|uniref:Uncharacterized protein n=3 Tax=Rhizophagus irregularis TaxID=588596 RepID=A0A015KCR3_RHIIW|nr:hypothetical protein GLOIN_2v1654930 [Rhizophagus irregularis DAOM 181602=DAOM 197198]EXX60417.1 hypothetical protein RirG_180070 [Rhizophagus irregularis DAOM 197198w]UZO19280.1 hypothetical protein OCT59_010578 [Rhizophagus irregularis]EXX79572.1 hypothetical protein RirG_004260 [Rhizophagus irregularis DAOM 197198w]POG66714.1 hypothetical protein GLOIN_2v1654930 [Rhizophagus irregularis DAOM 181602=DAOM 197198]CAB4374913.1 unnamed protein product [Rhizophagus irregularis]|eukprot:XP_025173580.1 hypothetical protein GLOIN_2v1654930 [Rhizophagus irregularis DAOM 181602=DAOM 197198]
MSTAPNNLDLVEALQSTGCKLFYQPPNDINIYHVTCEMVFQSENSVSCDDDIFDYEFFYQNYHVKCKLLSHYLVVNMLNKEIYNRDFDANELRHRYSLTSYQKLNLELNLREILPLYLYIPNGSLHGNTEGNVTPNQIYSDNNVPDNNCVVYNHVTNENARHQQQ